MKTKKISLGVVIIAVFVGLCAGGWSLNSDDDKAMFFGIMHQNLAALRWALGGDVQASTVCEIYAAGRRMDGRKVRVKAQFYTDHIEHSGLQDTSCPHKSIGLAGGKDLVDNAESRKFNDLVRGRMLEPSHLINVEVEGAVESPARSLMETQDRAIVTVHRYIEVTDGGIDPV